MKHLLWIAAGLILTAVAAAMILRQTKGDAHARDIATAVLITLASAELSMIPMMLVRRSGPIAHFQAAFGGTVLHLFLTFALGATAYALHLVPDRQIFLFLLLGFYWISLVFVVLAMIRLFRRSVSEHPSTAGDTAAKSS
ncbi:MAG: hypothetical protein JWN40_5194 [Phycisphaerales bacterium]|nr:hypothetical protein [Phycisphaerales bacterium]